MAYEELDKQLSEGSEGHKEHGTKPYISPAVVRRLPRYYRYLRELLTQGITRISSSELSARMNVTASQIRQDLNCFGGFGQQGYGYNVHYLFTCISEILGVGAGFHAIIIGAGDLGRAWCTCPCLKSAVWTFWACLMPIPLCPEPRLRVLPSIPWMIWSSSARKIRWISRC